MQSADSDAAALVKRILDDDLEHPNVSNTHMEFLQREVSKLLRKKLQLAKDEEMSRDMKRKKMYRQGNSNGQPGNAGGYNSIRGSGPQNTSANTSRPGTPRNNARDTARGRIDDGSSGTSGGNPETTRS